MNLPEELKKVVKGEVVTDPATLEKDSRDASVFRMKPEVVVCPKDVEDIKNLVKFVADQKKTSLEKKSSSLSLTARAAGTDMSGGPLTDSIVVSMTEHINHIWEIGKEFGIVQPGVYYRDFEKATMASGQLFPSFPASKNICAIGGIVNNNAGGEKSLSYGKTIRYVEEMKVVLRDGEEHGFTRMREDGLKDKMKLEGLEGEIYTKVYELLNSNYDLIQKHRSTVSKNSTGYQIWDVWIRGKTPAGPGRPSGIEQNGIFDMSKLFVGSQGTLGIMTEVKLGLVPVKNSKKLMVIFLQDFASIPQVVETVLKYEPTAFECFDEFTTKLAVQYFPDLLAIVAKHYPGLSLSRTGDRGHEFTKKLLDQAVAAKLVLLVEFEGDNEEECRVKMERLVEGLRAFNLSTKVIEDSMEREVWWAVRHESFNLLRSKVQGKYAAPFIDDLIVQPQFIPEFLPKLYEILNQSKMTFTVAGHIGDGNFHIFPLMDMASPVERGGNLFCWGGVF
jgi:FAD/FMN-containing dehydrogenase